MKLGIISACVCTLLALAAAFFTGFDYGKKTVTVKEQVAVLGDWQHTIDAATGVAKDFQALASKYIDAMDKQTSTNTSRAKAAKAITNAHPLPTTAVLDPDLVQLRCNAIQDLYVAAGRAVPGQCVPAATPATAAAGKPKG